MPIPPSFHHTFGSTSLHFFTFLFCVVGHFLFFFVFGQFSTLHLATKNKSRANHKKDFCEKNASKLPYFKGMFFRKSPYIDNGFQQVATKFF